MLLLAGTLVVIPDLPDCELETVLSTPDTTLEASDFKIAGRFFAWLANAPAFCAAHNTQDQLQLAALSKSFSSPDPVARRPPGPPSEPVAPGRVNGLGLVS